MASDFFEYYKDWFNIVEQSLHDADECGWLEHTALSQSHHALILNGLANLEKGIDRLGKGDKRLFKFDAHGELAMAKRPLFHWAQMLTRIEIGENGIDEKRTPLWTEFSRCTIAACQAWQECALHILESMYLDEPGLTVYGDWIKNEFAAMPFPDTLPPVPDPLQNTFIRTGDTVLHSGIWEPVDTPRTSLISILTGKSSPRPPFKVVGSMNYLHESSRAPQITLETASDNININTTWRLLWEDQRYLDGSVPGEEKDYRFTKP